MDVLGPVSLHSAEGHRYLAVVVDTWSGHVWTYPLCDLDGESCAQMLHAYHAFLAQCGAANGRITDRVDSDVSCALSVPLPWAVDVLINDGPGRPRVVRTNLRLDPSRGRIVNAAECASRQLLFRAVHYMILGELSPRMLRAMLQAATAALNYSPRTRPNSASRYQEWRLQPPNVAAFAAQPGALVSYNAVNGSAAAERGLGVFVCPGIAPSETFVFDLEQGITLSVSGLKSDVSPFIGLALRSSSSTQCYFIPEDGVCAWARTSFGAPRNLGDGLGLATDAWLGPRGDSAWEAAAAQRDVVDGALSGLTPIPDLNAPAMMPGFPDLTVSADLVDSVRDEWGRLGTDIKATSALLGSAAELVAASIGETPNAI